MSVAESVAQLFTNPQFRGMAAANLSNASAIDDVLQDVAEIALRHLPADHPNPGGWLGLVLKRECWAINRATARMVSLEDLQEPDAADKRSPKAFEAQGPDMAEIRCELADLDQALEQLKPQERAALSDLADGYSYGEIQERHGWSYTKVNRCISEGRGALRELVAA